MVQCFVFALHSSIFTLFTATIPPSKIKDFCHLQAPFVCFADIFPANGEIYPLHKGGFGTQNIL